MNISWMRFKSFCMEQNGRVASWDTNKTTDHIGVLIRGITVVFVIKNQLFLKLWIFRLFCIPFVSESTFVPRQQTIFKGVIFLGIFSLSLEYM